MGWLMIDPVHYELTRVALGLKLSSSTQEESQYLRSTQIEISPVVEVSPTTAAKRKLESAVQATFTATIRNCLGDYCMKELFSNDQQKDHRVQRIAVLAPEQQTEWGAFLESVQSLPRDEKDKTAARLLFSTHVPAYGYGRNHGWTRIVRIVDDLPRQAQRMVNGDRAQYAVQVRQLTRWHCRLNHVAAHTAMLSVFADDLMARPASELMKILSFIGVKPTQSQIDELLATSSWRDLMKRLKNSAFPVNEEYLNMADEALGSEIKNSDGLHQWPCPSFLELEQTHGTLAHSRYFDLSADCSDPFVKCSVNFDKKEQRPKQ